MANTFILPKKAERNLQLQLMLPSIAQLAIMTDKEREYLVEELLKKIEQLNDDR